jgi:hypothetical protein
VVVQKVHEGLDLVWICFVQELFTELSNSAFFLACLTIKLSESGCHTCSDFKAFWIGEEALFDKLFPASNIKLRANQINERLDVLILTQRGGCKSDFNMSKNRIANLFALFGRQPLGLIENDKTPWHFFEPLV